VKFLSVPRIPFLVYSRLKILFLRHIIFRTSFHRPIFISAVKKTIFLFHILFLGASGVHAHLAVIVEHAYILAPFCLEHIVGGVFCSDEEIIMLD